MNSKSIYHLEQLRHKLRTKKVSRTANVFDLDANPMVLDEVIKLVKAKKIDEVICHGDAFDRGHQNLKVFENLKILKDLLGQKLIYLLGNHELFMLDALFLKDNAALIDWMSNGGYTVLEEFGTTEKIFELAQWVFLHSKLFYIDDKGWLHVHAGIPDDFTLKIMYTEQAAFEKLQDEFIESGNFKRFEYQRIFEKMDQIFWMRNWADKFLDVSSDITLNYWLNSFQIQGVMFGHDHHSVLLNIGNRILGADIANRAYIIANPEGIFLHQLGKPTELIISYDRLIYRIEYQIRQQ